MSEARGATHKRRPVTDGVPVHAPLRFGGADPFWQALDDGTLRLPRCPRCDAWQWYPLPVCGSCRAAEPEWVDVPNRGIVFTFTTVHRSFLPEGAVTPPYNVGLVTLDGVEGPRLVSVLTGCGEDEPFVDMPVRMELLDLGTHRLPVFVPAGVTQ